MGFESSTAVVRAANGIQIHTTTGRDIVADGSGSDTSSVTLLSHAHTDHLIRSTTAPVVCSSVTSALAEIRLDRADISYRESAPNVDLLPAGHIIGSRAALITDEYRYLYTGDVCTRDRLYLNGFQPVHADVLIVEATYGRPQYEFPPYDELEAAIIDWITAQRHRPVLLFGYPLGRAQKLHQIALQAPVDRIFLHPTIHELSGVVQAATDRSFPAEPLRSDRELTAGDVAILPTSAARSAATDQLVNRTNAVKAGFSGWAIDDGYRYQGGYDVTFPLSDHCDFPELLDLVSAVDPEIVYTHHGSADRLAREITDQLGIQARPLRRNQTSLAEF